MMREREIMLQWWDIQVRDSLSKGYINHSPKTTVPHFPIIQPGDVPFGVHLDNWQISRGSIALLTEPCRQKYKKMTLYPFLKMHL